MKIFLIYPSTTVLENLYVLGSFILKVWFLHLEKSCELIKLYEQYTLSSYVKH